MGLRAKLGLFLLASFLSLTLVSADWLQTRLIAHYEEIERAEAEQAMVRLLRTIEAQVAMVNRTTEEWSNWTELYYFMSRGGADFIDENLSLESIKTSRLSAVQLRDLSGKQIAIAEVPNAAGRRWISDFTASKSPLYDGYLKKFTAESPPFCGLAIISPKAPVLLLCDHPIHTSGGGSKSNGRLLAIRAVDAATIAEIEGITQLSFRVALFDQPGKVFDGSPAIMLSPMKLLGNERTPSLAVGDKTITVAYPLHGLVTGALYGWIYLDYPRAHFIRVREQALQAAKAVGILIVLTTLLMLIAIDHLVVRRLLKLQREVESATRDVDWTQRVSREGEDELGSLASRVNILLEMIQAQVRQLSELSLTDTLTGLPNRRAFDQRLALAVKRHQRERTAVALLIIDVDNFKKYNDRYGHPEGDEALRKVAKALLASVQRATDLVARIGGEEFALLLEDTEAQGATITANRALELVRSTGIAHQDNPPGVVTISIGLTLLTDGADIQSIYRCADAALYQAKQNGRDRVVCSAA
ncbi:MAG: diguanylate cyclase [Rhodocyclaceae bacterium]|jgi:diguanylate cyclase (GGDEF)-like protein|nr:diguanylate cyclase [Rhodocyclaceae bacterium]MBK6905954.1 diguanylate cyclase [Rhodocyclaceae bacterium]